MGRAGRFGVPSPVVARRVLNDLFRTGKQEDEGDTEMTTTAPPELTAQGFWQKLHARFTGLKVGMFHMRMQGPGNYAPDCPVCHCCRWETAGYYDLPFTSFYDGITVNDRLYRLKCLGCGVSLLFSDEGLVDLDFDDRRAPNSSESVYPNDPLPEIRSSHDRPAKRR